MLTLRSRACSWFPIAALVVLATVSPAAAAFPGGAPLEIDAVLSTTGRSAFFGTQEARALAIIEKDVNAHGGVNGHPLHFVVLDDQTDTQVSVQLVNGLVAKNVPLFLGPEVPQTCLAAAPIIDKTGPVGICLNPAGHPEAGSYQLDPYPDEVANAIGILKYFQDRGLTRLGFLNSSDASGREASGAFASALRLPQFARMTKVIDESYNPTDISVAAQIARIKAAGVQGLVSFNTGTPFGTVLHGMRDGGLDVPIATTGGNMTFNAMKQYADFLPSTMLFDGLIGFVPGDIPPGPIHDLQVQYLHLLDAEHLRPEAGYATVWDAAMLAIDAYRHLGTAATMQQMHAYFAALHGWVGIQGVYDFKSYPQRGVASNALMILTWDKERGLFVPASKRGGALR